MYIKTRGTIKMTRKLFLILGLLKFVNSQRFTLDCSNELGVKCDCVYEKQCNPSNALEIQFCQIFINYYDSSSFCSPNGEKLIINSPCNQIQVLCPLAVEKQTNFPDLLRTTFSRFNVNKFELTNKNYFIVPDKSFNTLFIEYLNLASNRIQVVSSRAFDGIKNLRGLRLSENEIDNIDLSYLTNLEALFLDRNKLSFIIMSMFMNLNKLKVLDLSYNRIWYMDSESFRGVPDLRYLNLGSNMLKNFEADLNMKKLVSLSLNGNRIYNFTSKSFLNLSFLKILSIEQNELSVLSPGLFDRLTNLNFLNLANNHLLEVELDTLLYRLNNLKGLSLNHNKMQAISLKNWLQMNSVRCIAYLSMNMNKITEIKPFSFKDFKCLEFLDLSNLMLLNLSGAEIFYGLDYLSKIKLNNNSLTWIHNNTFIYLNQLEYLDLSSNEIEYLEINAFRGLRYLFELNLSDNLIKNLSSNCFRPLTNLNSINLNKNNIYGIEENSFLGFEKKLVTLSLQSNKLQYLNNNFFKGLNQLYRLYLRGNQISSIQRDTFKDLIQLITLDLSENSIAQIDSFIFKNLPEISILDLSHNVLLELKPGSFQYLKQLKQLNLGFNRLVKANFKQVFSIESNILLGSLNLENNSINEFDINWFVGLNSLETLNLNNNKFSMRVVEKKSNLTILLNLKYLSLTNAPIQLVRQFDLQNLLLIDFSFSQLDHSIILGLPLSTIQTLSLTKINGVLLNFPAWKNFGLSLSYIDFGSNQLNIEEMWEKIELSCNLQTLVLTNTTLNDSYPLSVYLYFYPELVYLDISCNQISKLSQHFFQRLKKLVYLNMSHNSIRIINQDVFPSLFELQWLDLSRNSIEIIEKTSFSSQKKLVYLDLSHNRLNQLDQLAFGDNYLYNLETISLKGNKLISKCEFHIQSPYMKKIDLSENNLTNVPSLLVQYQQRNEKLDFSNNKIKVISKSDFKTANKMFSLSFRDNQIELIEPDSFVTLMSLLTLDLGSNCLSNLSTNSFRGLHNLQELYLCHNRLEIVQKGLLDSQYYLEKLELTNNSIKLVEEGCFSQNKFLSRIYLAENPLQTFFRNETFKGLYSLQYLELPQHVDINYEASLVIKTTINIRFFKKVLNISYFNSIDIVSLDPDHPVNQLASYTETECFHIMFLSRNKVNLNIFNSGAVEKFVDNCQDWAADMFASNQQD